MRYQALAFLLAVGSAAAQAVTAKVAPAASAPAGCKPSIKDRFEIAIVELSDKAKREHIDVSAEAAETPPTILGDSYQEAY